MKIGLILNNFSVSKDRNYLWSTIQDTVVHYKYALQDVSVFGCASGFRNSISNTYFDELYTSTAGTIESQHNNPKLITKAINSCKSHECEKILFINPYYRIKNFDFLDSKIAMLLEDKEYAEDRIRSRNISFDFLYGPTDFISKAWEKQPWNYKIQEPSQNLFSKINNLSGSRKILSEGSFFTKKDLSIQEIKVFWKSNIKYINH